MNIQTKKEIIPLYSRVSNIIHNKIVSGQYEPGEKLPTEDELALNHGVSKITIRNALARLEADGLINRVRAKGTFVSEAIPETKQYIYTSLERMDRAFKKSHTKPLDLDIIQVGESRTPHDIRTFFGIENGDRIGRIRRIVTMKDVPYLYENYLWPDMARQINKKELSKVKSIQEILRKKIGLVITKGEMFLQAIPAEPDISDMLECQSFDPLIHIQTFFWIEAERPFEIVNVYFRSCYFKYKVEVDVKRI